MNEVLPTSKDSFFCYKYWINSAEITMSHSFCCPGSENTSHNIFLIDNFLDMDAGFSK